MTQMTLQQALTLAIQHQQAGRFEEAEAVYRSILAADPNNPEALHLLGVLASQHGNYPVAIELIRQAIARAPQSHSFYCNLGQVYLSADQPDEAIRALRSAINLKPNYPEAANNLASALQSVGKIDEAIRLFKEVIAQRPSFAEAHNNLGNAYRANGQYPLAIDALQKAISLKPDYASAYNGLGSALRADGLNKDAIAAFRKALSLRPAFPEALNNLGNALHADGDDANAINALTDAARMGPGSAEVRNNLGSVYRDRGDHTTAISWFDEAIKIEPTFADAHNNRASALQAMGRIDEAIEGFRKAIQYRPADDVAHVNLGITLLLKGNLSEGFAEYEHRWNDKERAQIIRRIARPQWNGEPIKRQRLLVHAEQGFGDTIQFIRFLPQVAELSGAKVFVQCQKPLIGLIQQVRGIDKLFEQHTRLPDVDFHIPLLSLPHVLKTDLGSIPASKAAYLSADKKLAKRWRALFDAKDTRRKIGLVWAGQREHLNDKNRSMKLDALAALKEVKNARFYSLQKGEAADQLDRADSLGLSITDFAHELHDFSDTAALIDHLDLVITVDTAVAHVAGAMGKPAFLLLPHVPDWRWLLDRADSPWYGSMTLFRQPKLGDWETPVRQIVQTLG